MAGDAIELQQVGQSPPIGLQRPGGRTVAIPADTGFNSLEVVHNRLTDDHGSLDFGLGLRFRLGFGFRCGWLGLGCFDGCVPKFGHLVVPGYTGSVGEASDIRGLPLGAVLVSVEVVG